MTIVLRCNGCDGLIGIVTDVEFAWVNGPGRHVNKCRPVSRPSEDPIARDGVLRFWVSEYAQTCDSDKCMDALGPEWKTKKPWSDGSLFKLFSPGRAMTAAEVEIYKDTKGGEVP